MKNRLEEERLRRGWTQQELADRVEVSRQTVISLERGRYNPSIVLAFKLARLLELSIENLFLYEEDDHDKADELA
jgi:putative transcriptional regulator